MVLEGGMLFYVEEQQGKAGAVSELPMTHLPIFLHFALHNAAVWRTVCMLARTQTCTIIQLTHFWSYIYADNQRDFHATYGPWFVSISHSVLHSVTKSLI